VWQSASVDGDAISRNCELIAGYSGDHLKQWLCMGRASSDREISSAPAKLGGNGRCAHRDEAAAFDSAPRQRSEAINAERHTRREIEVETDCGDRTQHFDENAQATHSSVMRSLRVLIEVLRAINEAPTRADASARDSTNTD
jgi:hypothetical protein